MIQRAWREGRWAFTREPGRFTAKLTTNFSTEADWVHLGRVAAREGVPRDVVPITDNDPEAEHVWSWAEQIDEEFV